MSVFGEKLFSSWPNFNRFLLSFKVTIVIIQLNMPIIKSAKKALRSSKRKKTANDRYREKLRRLIKQFRKNPVKKDLPPVFSILDRSAKKHIIHKNKAARLKSRLTQLIKKPTKTSKSVTANNTSKSNKTKKPVTAKKTKKASKSKKS